MAREPFVWGGAGQRMSPKQVDERRKIAQALLEKASDTSPVGHWTAALNRGLQGVIGSWDRASAENAEAAGRAGLEAKRAGQANAVTFGGADPVAAALSGGSGLGNYAVPAGGEVIREGLIARGLPEHVADGFIMNFQDESGLNPGINERNPIVPGSRGGFGLYQLTGPRRTAYEQFAGQRGVDPSDVDAQLDWLMYELQGPEAKAAQSIFSAGNAGEAGAAIVNNFLRPAAEHRQSRASRYMGQGAAPANSTANIAALLADEWLPDSERAVLQAQYESQLKQQDPMYQAQYEGQVLANQTARQPKQTEYQERQGVGEMMGLQGDALQRFVLTGDVPATAEDFTLGEGDIRYDANGNVIAQGGPKTPTPDEYQRYVQEAQAAGQPVLDRIAYSQAIKGKGFSMTMPDGTVVQMGGAQGQGPEFNDTGAFKLDTVLGDIDAILASDLARVTGPIQGGGGNMVDELSWPQRILAGEEGLTTIERIGNLQNKTWMAARDMLKGGGSITDYESKKAEGAMARLSRVKSESDMRSALKDLRDAVVDGKRKLDAAKGGATPTTSTTANAPVVFETMDDLLNADISSMTSEQMDAWEARMRELKNGR